MTHWLGFLWLLFLCAVASWLLGALTAVVLSRFATEKFDPTTRLRRALLVALTPWLVPITTLAAIIGLAASKPLGLVTDHCVYHGPGHPHLCLGHLPEIPLGVLHLATFSGVCAVLLVFLLRHVVRHRQVALRLRSMRTLSRGCGRLRRLDSPRPLALAANPRDPFVLMSRGLLERLSRRERRVVLAHEVAHVRRNDLVRNLVFEILLLAHFRHVADRLRRAWRQAMEERADDGVAARFGSETVARTLVRVIQASRLERTSALSISGADPLRRVERLLQPAPKMPGSLGFEVGFAGALVLFAGGIVTSHHAVETALGFLTGS